MKRNVANGCHPFLHSLSEAVKESDLVSI